MEGPGGSKVPAIGEALAQARAGKGLSLRDVEGETKIRLKYLRALEAEDWGALPGPAYAVGFLRTYAELVGLDADELVVELKARLEDAPAEQRYPAGEPVLSGRERSGAPRRGLRLFAVLAIGLLLVAAALTVVAMVADDEPEPGSEGGRSGDARSGGGDAGGAAAKQSHGPMELVLSLRDDVPVCLLGDGSRPLIDNQVLGAGSEERFSAERFELRFPDGFERSQLRLELDGEPTPLKPSLAPAAYKLRGPGDAVPVSAGKDCP